jgi:hypothetical protein
MPRFKRKVIDITNDSLKSLLQEIYNQACEERTNAIRLRNRIERDMKVNVDISILSKALGDTNKLIQDSISKKLMVAKMLLDTMNKNGDSSDKKDTVAVSNGLSSVELRKMIKDGQNKK